MARSRFDRDSNRFTASRVFSNRQEQIDAFDAALRATTAEAPRVLVFYGIAGIGKTRLSQHLIYRIDHVPEAEYAVATIDFRVPELCNAADALNHLARQFKFPCPTFEFAAMRRWAMLGRSLEDFRSRIPGGKGGPVLDILDYVRQVGTAALEGGNLVPGVPLLTKLARTGLRRWTQWRNENRALLEDLETLSLAELGERLPFYLGRDIASRSRSRRTILVFDAMERIHREPQRASDQWVRDLVAPASGCLAVIATRERLKWHEYSDEEWDQVIEQHRVGTLSDEDVESYLIRVPVPDKDMRGHIRLLSRGMPFLLDLCVSIYEQIRGDSRTPHAADFGHDSDEIVAYFLDHLSNHERESTRLLSLAGLFDEGICRRLMDKFGLSRAAFRFSSFRKRGFVDRVSDRMFSIDPTIAQHCVQASERLLIHEVHAVVAQEHDDRLRTGAGDAVLPDAFRHAWSQPVVQDDRSLMRVLALAQKSFDQGLWLEIGSALEHAPGSTNEAWSNLNLVLRGIVARRTGRLADALEMFRRVDFGILGTVERFARFHHANAVRLSGDYEHAFKLYRELRESRDGEIEPLTERRIDRQFGDLLMLRGRFGDAFQLYEALRRDVSDPIEDALIRRQMGHVLRFNYMLEQAGEQYESAQQLAKQVGSVATRYKLATNLLETAAMVGTSCPNDVLAEAIDGNRAIGAMLEVGKALAARALLRVMLGDPEGLIEDDINQAKRIQQKIGYRAGEVFALFAQACLELRRGRDPSGTVERLRGLCESIGVYRFVLGAFEPEVPSRVTSSVQWFDGAQAVEGIRRLRHQLESLSPTSG